MATRIRLSLSEAALAAQPDGAPVGATLVVRNDGTLVDEVRLHVEGLDPAWYQLSPPSLRLLPGGQADVRLEVQVPAGASAETLAFRVVATAQSAPDEPVAVDATLEVAATGPGGLELTLHPQRVAARRVAH